MSKYGRIAVKRDDFEKQENNVQQPVKLLLVPVPLDAVQCVPFHVKPAHLLVTCCYWWWVGGKLDFGNENDCDAGDEEMMMKKRRRTNLQTSLTSSPTNLCVGTESSISFKQFANPDQRYSRVWVGGWGLCLKWSTIYIFCFFLLTEHEHILGGNAIFLPRFTYLKNIDAEDRIPHSAN